MPMKDLPPKARAEAQAILDDAARRQLDKRLAEEDEAAQPKRPVGRPEVGPMVNVRMPEDLIAWVDEQVAERGGTRAAFIRDVLQAAKEAQQ
ncbi:MAG: ribbon-helix-helix domain-containing protein [Solirubrobacteraceae bacterium]